MKLRTVPAATGLQWVGLGVRTFLRQPLAMSGLFFLFMGTITVLSLIPLLGTALSALLTPAANLGLMAASKEASEGRFPMPSQLLTAFRAGPAKTRSMLTLGGLYALSLLVVLLMASLFDTAAPELAEGATPEAMLQATMGNTALWVALVAMLPVQMMFWHAPALLHWHGVPPVKSLFFSAMACWANKAALLLFMFGWCGIFLLAGMLVSMLGAALGAGMGAVLYPAVLFMASMFFTSFYFTYRDSFYGSGEPPAVPEAPPGNPP
jgi:hypothetical protein